MESKAFETYESQVRSYCRSFPAVFTRALGSEMFDEDGNRYVDFFCGAGALNYGHNNPTVKKAMVEYLMSDGIIHGMDMYTAPKRAFLTTLQEKILKPRGFNYKVMCCGPTGTNGVEAALKLARKVTGRTNVFAFMGAFHGMSMGALSMTTEAYARKGAGVPLCNVTHIPTPYMFPGLDVVAYMQQLLDDDHSGVDKPAALVMETVQAEGGIFPFSVEFLKGCEEFCRRNGIVFIVDDIQAGICRTGTFFSFERAGIHPDLVILSKSIGASMPLTLLLIKPDNDIFGPAEHNGTFRGNQLAFVAGNAGLNFLLESNLEAEVQRKSKIVENFIVNEILPLDERLHHRGIGLMWGVDCDKLGGGVFSRAVMQACFRRKLILERAGRDDSVVKLMPALNISDDVLMEGLNILKEAFIEVLEANK